MMSINCVPKFRVLLRIWGEGGPDDWRYRLYRQGQYPESYPAFTEQQIEGFGELFRQLSYEEIGTSTIQSRVFAGLSNRTIVFCLPGSPGACRTGWESIIQYQLDSTHRPCNFVDKLVVD